MKMVRHLLTAVSLLVVLIGCASSNTISRHGEPFSSAQSHFAPFGTNKVHYLTAGKGQAVMVFVHGWSCNAGFWREQVPAFADKARLIPLLVMNTKSPVYTPEYEAYARSLSAMTDYRTFEGVGHFMMLEKPAVFNSALADMLHEFNLLAR